MYHSGMRISNIINLKVEDVNFTKGWQNGRTCLQKSKWKGKSHTYIDKEFVPLLRKYKDKLGLKKTDYWFTSRNKDKKGIHKRYTQGGSINN